MSYRHNYIKGKHRRIDYDTYDDRRDRGDRCYPCRPRIHIKCCRCCRCITCYKCICGPTGPTGPIGPTGFCDCNGEQGPTGPTGPIGPTGFCDCSGGQGPTGPTGFCDCNGGRGPTGPTGPTGARGLGATCFKYTISTTPANTGGTNPGSGYINFNQATIPNSAIMYMSVINSSGFDISPIIDFLSQTNPTGSAIATIYGSGPNPALYMYLITGGAEIIDTPNYYAISITNILSEGNFADDEPIIICFSKIGDPGRAGLNGTNGIDGQDGQDGPTGPTGSLNQGVASIGRNWLFGNAQSGGAGNVGLVITLSYMSPQIVVKFTRDSAIPLGNDILNHMTFLVYSSKALTLRLKLYKCSYGESAVPITHGASDISIEETELWECPQVIVFTFPVPIVVDKEVIEILFERVSDTPTPNVGIWQIIVD
jgi:hypothetical protein